MSRTTKTFTLSKSQLERLKKASDKTLIPQSRLVEKGIEHVLKAIEKQQQEEV